MEDERTRAARKIVHDMRNQLAVAIANLEGVLDGKLEPSPARVQSVLTALETVDGLIGDLYTAMLPGEAGSEH